MQIIQELRTRNAGRLEPFLIGPTGTLTFDDIAAAASSSTMDTSRIAAGDVVALVGDFDGPTIATMLQLLDSGVILMPLTPGTRADHDYFFDSGGANWVIRGRTLVRRQRLPGFDSSLLDGLRVAGHAGIIFYSSGTTGRPKAILHDFDRFLERYAVSRAPLRALNFLLFDHAGGINTLLHTLFNGGVVVVPTDRTPETIAADMAAHEVELLPATPTFLRMMLLAGVFESTAFPALRVVTYGTERMDQGTLDRLCELLPAVDFRQTYGLSELGVFKVRSKARDSLWMQIGGAGIATRVVNDVLHIHSDNRMLGYLNAPSPFADGWYDTGDIVEINGDYIRIVGRENEVINVGGLKILPGEIERVALLDPGVLRAKAYGVSNPITGQHIEVICQPKPGASLDRRQLTMHFRAHLQKQLCPHRVIVGEVPVSHRFKQK
ncbi:MAG: fatty acid--CoA ligase family protein [Gemmatimonadaceae bacterium]